MVATATGTACGRVEDRRLDQPPDRGTDAGKSGITGRKLQCRAIPPEEDAECAACMEHVLEIYERPYDARYPVVCEVEQPVQLVQETRVSLPTTTEHLKPIAHGCKRASPASVFRFCEPMAGRRQATPTCDARK